MITNESIKTKEQEKVWWAIYVDIEGYSEIFRKNSSRGMNLSVLLADDICKVASKLQLSNSLGFYQFGADGFLIKPQMVSSGFSLAISISVALLRMALRGNSVRKVKISYGNLADYSSWYRGLGQQYNGKMKGDRIDINFNAVILATAVIGDGLIKAYNLKCPHGPLLCIDNEYKEEINQLQLSPSLSSEKSISINWLNLLNEYIESEVTNFIGENLDLAKLKEKHKKYLEEECTNLPSDCEWLINAKHLIE